MPIPTLSPLLAFNIRLYPLFARTSTSALLSAVNLLENILSKESPTRILPSTCNFCDGVVVPIPTFPEDEIANNIVLL